MLRIPNEVWLAGKGPSLDDYDWGQAGFFRVALNEAYYKVPNCKAIVLFDSLVRDKLVNIPKDILVIHPENCNFNHMNLFNLTWSRGIDVSWGFATAPAALEILANMGAKYFHLIGFNMIHEGIDLDNLYAPSLKLKPNILIGLTYRRYKEIIKDIGKIIKEKKLWVTYDN